MNSILALLGKAFGSVGGTVASMVLDYLLDKLMKLWKLNVEYMKINAELKQAKKELDEKIAKLEAAVSVEDQEQAQQDIIDAIRRRRARKL